MRVPIVLSSDCHMVFDNSTILANHQLKFCTNSKYANMDTLTSEYTKLQQARQPSKIPISPHLKQSQAKSQAIINPYPHSNEALAQIWTDSTDSCSSK